MIEIVTIGDELLLGQTIDTNAAFLSEQLAAAGLRVTRRTTVGDDAADIAAAVADALARTRTVITTGGLGPTRDDFTKPVIADLYGVGLHVDEVLLDKMRERWAQRGMAMPESNRTQAEVPDGATILPNRLGSASGLALDGDAGLTIMLPGVPHELRDLTVREVVPFLLARATQRTRPISYRVLRVTGVPESMLAERINDIVDDIAPLAVAFLPGFAGVDLRITNWGVLDEDECNARFDAAERSLRERLGLRVFATGSDEIEVVVGRLLSERGLTVSVAESCTAGLLGGRITRVDGSSAYFMGGFLTYSNDSKIELLGVSRETIETAGAVSEEVAREMAEGAARRLSTDVAISITGVAGPGGGTEAKPVGLVWTAVKLGADLRTRQFIFPGDRSEVRERSTQMALALLYEMLVSRA